MGLIVVLSMILGIAPEKAMAAAPPLRVALIPLENPERLIDDVKPVMSFLEKQMGRKIRYFITLNYSAAVEAMNAGKADISFISPLPFVLANKHAGAQVVLGEVYNGKSYYHAQIFVRKDSGIKTLADLKGKTIAYVDPVSSSGFMYPHDIFIRAGLVKGGMDNPEGGFFRRVYFAGGDEQAIRSVHSGFVDAAGVSQFSINLLRVEERDDLVAISQSSRIPSHAVIVRKGLDPKSREQFVKAMLKLNEPQNRPLANRLYGTDGYVRAQLKTYQTVVDLARKYGFIKP
ncbi:MAG: phosphate/phosphite/phosphonate ABC transporter substrate-binding protein [bacterium]|nr:phosphate/phosphite/phosphonate ABC transporter substrate-binding protein [bacterium]